jgi:armadillo repeat-containing protein 7
MKHSIPSVSTFLHADPANALIITQCGGIPLVIQCLSSPVRNTVSISEANDTIILVPLNSVHVVLMRTIPPLMIARQVTYALGALYYLCNPSTKKEILKPDVVSTIREYASAGTVNNNFSNLANAFLEKHVDP